MAYMITDECVNCGGCMGMCANNAIIETKGRTYIEPDRCSECVGINWSPMCPTICAFAAIKADPNRREKWEELMAKWQKLHPKEKPGSPIGWWGA